MGFYELQRMRIYNRKVRMNNMVEMKNQNNQCAANNVDMQFQCAMGYSQQFNRLIEFVQSSNCVQGVQLEKATAIMKELQAALVELGKKQKKFKNNLNNTTACQLLLKPYQDKLKGITSKVDDLLDGKTV